MMKNGITESLVFIVDCAGIGWFNSPFMDSRPVFQMLSNCLKAKVQKIFCVNCEASFVWVWNTVKLMIDAPTVHKVEYSYSKSCDSMFTMMSPAQVEKKYGGTSDDMVNYWPPRLLSDDFQIDKQRLQVAKKKQKER